MPIHVAIKGRIRSVRKTEKSFAHLIAVAAIDPYSSPDVYEVYASRRLGDAGADVEVRCELRGYPRTYQVKDSDGAVRQVRGASLSLWAED